MGGLGVTLCRQGHGLSGGSFGLLHVKRTKINWLKHQWLEPTITNGIGENAAGKWKDDPWPFGEQEHLHLILRDVAQAKKAGIGKLNLKGDLIGADSFHFDLEDDFMDIIGKLIGTNIELDINLRLTLPLENGGCIGILKREILDILGDQARNRGCIFAVGQGIGNAIFGHFLYPVGCETIGWRA
jgi:hypothetical protein